mmetsp:Transcript_70838/g.125077  ORF Transcript_70838/g.125077 Transcript_70838/m.125077 type:complete len:1116 (-) Transcript_70838:13-3360(-)|eukprot:CAMPEP_0197658770 /NCGR_PEP_ID=MMETSP1338-20131121/45428_1 /TAXON_ID=43686 ORGANISM="Pelagodinium beii, Strain RCC1491" /NCGR_SAMPLE_ID=MMETSP1338 /ASSEMBLY_ACC=CAM_ASM_000754 /LENGTH=1115 /DNA_ID=CAMNT_0043235409 /DNA_START=50 /DNA_END=3400 /DNA_ORIENTATION=+
MATDEETGSNDPQAERLALMRRRREQVEYLKIHRTKLEKLAQRCVNRVLRELPTDPFEALLSQLSAHVKASGLAFSDFRVLPGGPESLIIEVSAIARAAPLLVHRAILARDVVARGLAAAAVPEPMLISDAEALETAALVPRLSASVSTFLDGVKVLDFKEIYDRISSAVPVELDEEAGVADASEEEQASVKQAGTVLRAVLAGELLEAAGKLMDCSSQEAVRAGILEYGGVSDEPEDEEACAAPLLTCQSDLETWQFLWPELCFPVLQGNTARRRMCIGLTCWASSLPETKAIVGAGDDSSWQLELIDEAAEEARIAALGDQDPATMDEDEIPDPEPHEYCPAMNAFTIVAELGHALAVKAGAGSSLPGEDFAAGLVQMRQMLETTMPQYVQQEKKMNENESGETQARIREQAAAKLAALRSSPNGEFGGESDEESMESEKPPAVLLHETQHRNSVYFMLHADADAAFDEEAGTYCFVEGEEAKTQAQLLQYYAELCKNEVLLKCIVAPLSPRDPDIEAGLKVLRSMLPKKVTIIDEAFPGLEAQDEDEMEELMQDSEEAPRREGIGRLQNLRLTAHGMALQRAELLKSQYGDAVLALAELGRSSVYDIGEAEELKPALGSIFDYSLACPEDTRRFLLPKMADAEETKQLLVHLDTRFRSMLLTAYRHKKSTDKRKQSKDLNMLQFREGLRRIGYQYTDDYAELIFAFLDQSGNGSLSPSELQMIELVNGPGLLKDLDDLRLWLCAWKARRMAAAEQKRLAEEAAGEAAAEGEAEGEAPVKKPVIEAKKVSPLYELWLYMDRDGSGEASFAEWRWALRKARHPFGLNPDKGPALELFMCLDILVDGTIETGEFFCLNILSAYFQLERVERVRKFLEDRFGTLKAAFKYIDADKSGSLTTEEWMEFMLGPQGYPDEEDIKVCFIFIDKDFSGQLTSKEFDFLGNFDGREFVADVRDLRDHIVEKYENLEDAYVAFEQRLAPVDMGGIEVSKLSEKKRKRREGRGLSGQDFVNACRLCGFKGKFDSRLHFNFLDAAHVGHITRNEFLQLGKLGAVEALHASSERMRKAIATLKAFVFKEAQLQAPEEEQEDERWKWAAVHKALRDATHDDMDLMMD